MQKGDIVTILGKLGGDPHPQELALMVNQVSWNGLTEVMLMKTGKRLFFHEGSIRPATDDDIRLLAAA